MKKFTLSFYFVALIIANFSYIQIGRAADDFFLSQSSLDSGMINPVIRFWNNTNGLPHNTIYAMEKDEFGFVWIATEEGLIRFDGSETKVFTRENDPKLKENAYYHLFPSPKEGIWAAGDYSLVFLQKNIYQVIDCFDIFENTWMAALLEDEDGSLWIGTRHGTLYHYKEGLFEKVLSLGGESTVLINDFLIDRNHLLIATNKGLYKLGLQKKSPPEKVGSEDLDIVKLIKHKSEIILGVHGGGLFQLDEFFQLHLLIPDSELPDFNYGSLSLGHAESIWGGTTDGTVIQFTGNKVIKTTLDEIADFNVRSVLANEHHLFIGTGGLGLAVVHQAEVAQFKHPFLSTQNIRPILMANDSSKWIGTASKGLYRIDDKGSTAFGMQQGLKNENIVSLAEWKGNIYVGTRGGLFVIDPNSNQVIKSYLPKDDFSIGLVHTLFTSKDGKLWFTLGGKGIYYFDQDENIQQPSLPENLSSSSYLSVYEDDQGLLYFGAIDQGLVILKDGLQQETLKLPLLPGEQIIYAITKDKDGDLWLGTQGGLLVFHNGLWHGLTRSQGLIANGIYSIVKDNQDHIWISSNFGLQRIPASELLRFKANPSPDFYLNSTLFDETQGMGNEETNSYIYPNVAVDSKGQLWYPTIRGVTIVDPSKSFANRSYQDFQWDIVQYGDSILDISGDLEIPAGNNWFIIKFSHIDYLNPDQTVFYYRLKGLKEDWVSLGQKRELLFSNLSPGNYTLEVRSLSFGNQEKIHQLNIRVTPLFYQTLGFKIILASILLFFIAFIYRFTLERRLGKKLEEMVAIRSKELHDSNKSLKNSLLEIEQKNQALKEINWQQSHMIRGPLTEAMGLANLLMKFDNYTYVKKSKHEIYERISSALEELDVVVREMNEKSENLEK
ncbi:ligand-binding sensor domain-containing protein [Cecembia lonarensis]|uniref:Response regulator containing a CheY-like receiver domain and a GGDEF domain protein n=1 Tax=Cecembia lonarensis (strain CCUG 58316 / KCTC 22772 / LW9) TaxID=1225176 RepID=K1M0F1_CECL9|nr:two-component regulator propeller domain-containing protein [Cecembia lonarensis]EKB49799.1 Response regulator containing a CheY-like receiver domain and a GGDEF domain protein [Cecembia lonarensis LW9]